ncbi:hypothetical protein RCF27_18785 [Rhodococcus pyridinivorans]|uniref:Uncharacterized protein n=1 Tax=Rhodococcus pyridinivorans TaxID=103816 RepID=A0A7M2XJP6_9NOCA|nr:hypothetical protein [Rhodococcus pyridinivorans]QOV98024.1 hypothetical protein INP59_19345 [Rhodococcus pyridinivorans]WMM71892.1 hypothetical protein RCF27_18785 [Rhodococcus pyridinivorans]
MSADGTSADLSAYRNDFARIEKKVAGEFDAGRRGRVLAICVVVLTVCMVLPQTSSAWSWTVFGSWFGDTAPVAVPLRIFAALALVFGVVISTLALWLRRWKLASLAMLGSGLSSFFGLLAYWSQAGMITNAPHHPTVALIAEWLVMIVMTSQWLPIVLSRSPTDVPPRPHPLRTGRP